MINERTEQEYRIANAICNMFYAIEQAMAKQTNPLAQEMNDEYVIHTVMEVKRLVCKD